MKKILLIATTLVTLSGSNAYSIDGWVGYPTPISEQVSNIYFVNSLTGWAVFGSGKIVKSTDGGITWTIQHQTQNLSLYSLSFINENTGWCAGGSRNLFTYNYYYLVGTTNGGNTWDSLFYGVASFSYLSKVHLQSPTLGFLLGDGGNGGGTEGFLLKSTSFGNSWSSVQTQTHDYWDIKFKDNNTGWAITKYGDDTDHDTATIIKTTNGGTTWNRIYFRNSLNIYSIIYIENDDIIASGQIFTPGNPGRIILRSTNGGQTWDSTLLSSGKIPLFIDFNTGWSTAANGIFKTTDGAVSFTQQSTSSTYSLFFVDSLHGWAAGDLGIIYRTTTGGVTNINQVNNTVPKTFRLYQNYPNPFNPSTNIRFGIANSSNVKISIYDVTGKLIEVLVNQKLSAGTYEIQWNADGFASGVYFYSLEAEGFNQTRKMLLIK
ncbi:MAG: T9SS type A sorting domain-containing protein [Ignavibacteriae bacterium]|nr:T9SS type A sorting domain-containing protein [Ignavibacteriota bacterium]